MINFEELCDKYEKEYLEFESIHVKLSQRPDIHAFILLDKLCPTSGDIISGAEHDEIFLDVDVEELNKVATEEQALELIRCGVRCGEYGLAMFV